MSAWGACRHLRTREPSHAGCHVTRATKGRPAIATQQAAADRLPRAGLVALSAATFVSMTTEFIPGGLIPNIAADFGAGVSQVGVLVSAFALTVILSATPLSVLTRRLPRKSILLVAFALIAGANLLAAAAPSFEMV